MDAYIISRWTTFYTVLFLTILTFSVNQVSPSKYSLWEQGAAYTCLAWLRFQPCLYPRKQVCSFVGVWHSLILLISKKHGQHKKSTLRRVGSLSFFHVLAALAAAYLLLLSSVGILCTFIIRSFQSKLSQNWQLSELSFEQSYLAQVIRDPEEGSDADLM